MKWVTQTRMLQSAVLGTACTIRRRFDTGNENLQYPVTSTPTCGRGNLTEVEGKLTSSPTSYPARRATSRGRTEGTYKPGVLGLQCILTLYFCRVRAEYFRYYYHQRPDVFVCASLRAAVLHGMLVSLRFLGHTAPDLEHGRTKTSL